MDNQIQFNIESMSCAYTAGRTILSVSNLPIYRGRLYFIIGLSGIGKSTFIEALGLMNNVYNRDSNSQVHFCPFEQTPVNVAQLWKGDNRTISAFRNRYFSFIFQSTNLMHNFTAGENMCVSQLIAGKSLEEAKPVVVEIMKHLNLPEEVFDKKVYALSGGQRQRLAFVRAITADFEVLFGDEPTGNLDRDTGFRLMQVLRSYLHDTRRTGIIVSHDLELALQFADRIIMLTPQTEYSEQTIGTVNPEDCMLNGPDGWQDSQGRLLTNPYLHISRCLGIQTN